MRGRLTDTQNETTEIASPYLRSNLKQSSSYNMKSPKPKNISVNSQEKQRITIKQRDSSDNEAKIPENDGHGHNKQNHNHQTPDQMRDFNSYNNNMKTKNKNESGKINNNPINEYYLNTERPPVHAIPLQIRNQRKGFYSDFIGIIIVSD